MPAHIVSQEPQQRKSQCAMHIAQAQPPRQRRGGAVIKSKKGRQTRRRQRYRPPETADIDKHRSRNPVKAKQKSAERKAPSGRKSCAPIRGALQKEDQARKGNP